MESQLTLSALQTNLFWEDKQKNWEQLGRQLEGLSPTDIIILPEMFTTGFSMEAEKNAESMEGETVQWMQQWAKKKNAVIAGSTVIKENNKCYEEVDIEPHGFHSTIVGTDFANAIRQKYLGLQLEDCCS